MTVTVLESIELLDFDPDVACEGPGHDHPAEVYAIVHDSCVFAVCRAGAESDRRVVVEHAGHRIRCRACDTPFVCTPDSIRVLGPIRGGTS